MTTLYLKPNTVIEPLVDHWHAWAHLISPITYAMNVKNRHIRVLKRFLQRMDEHKNIVNQKFESGPVVQLDASKRQKVQAILDGTLDSSHQQIALAEAIEKASSMIEAAEGKTLEPIYQEIDDVLKGLIEFVYDINYSGGIRFFETLAYKELYNTKDHALCFSIMDSDERPFILGTPRVEDEDNLIVWCAFDNEIIDAIHRSQFVGIDSGTLIEQLKLTVEQQQRLLEFFTEQAPAIEAPAKVDSNDVRVRYYGHACVLMETANTSVLIDPLISYKYPCDIERFSFSDLPESIDYVLISHAHQDHFSIENLLKIRHKVKNIVVPRNSKGNIADPSLKLVLEHIGFDSVIEVDEFDDIKFEDGLISCLPFVGEHAELDVLSKMVYTVRMHEKSVFFGADLNNFDPVLYQRAFRLTGKVDMVFLGMECDGGPLSWLYGALITREGNKEATKTRTLSGSNFDKAKEFIESSGCHTAYVYSMGEEPWLNFILNINYHPDALQITESNRFLEFCRESGINTARLFGKDEFLL